MSYLLYRSAVLSSLVALPALLVPAPAQAAGSELGTPRYDANKKAVLIPYFGQFPTFESDKLTGPPRIYFDFKASPRARRLITRLVPESAALVRWTAAPRPGGLTRVVLQFKEGADVLVLNDASRRQIVLTIQDGPAPALPSAAMPAMIPSPPSKAPISKVPEATRTFFQTFGHTDFKYSVGPRPKHAKHDRVTVEVAAQGISQFNVTADPSNDYINFSISIAGKGKVIPQPAPPVAETPRPLWTPPAPSPLPTPEPTATPEPTPSAEVTPTPEPTPSVEPTPIPKPPRQPEPDETSSVATPTTSLSFFGGFPVTVSEKSGLPDNPLHEFQADGASVQGVAFESRLGDWVYHLNVDHHRLLVTDEQTGNLTGNERDTYMLNTGLGYPFSPWNGSEMILGAGYHVRYLNTVSVGFGPDNVPSPIFPPEQATVLNAPAQLFHGPSFHTRLLAPFAEVFGLDWRLGGGVLFGALEVPEDIAPLFAVWTTPALYYDLGTVRTSLGFDISLANGGSGYNFNRLGPLARVEMRF
ncbi:MAG: hypothetical protein VKN33_05475 [Candidatus Sericytochromatia bacterium]|nr:hypothetical protein [Candidatus Sericytochromatia bacterium]